MRSPVLLLAAYLLGGCVSSTGGELVEFEAVAEGDEASRHFVSPLGYEVRLEEARLFIGALYLNQSAPGNYTQSTSCVLPGIYSAEVRGGLRVDALSEERQAFLVKGNGTTEPSRAGELWLASGSIDAANDTTVILEVRGEAERDGKRWPFEAQFTIGQNRLESPSNPALPGSNPLCKQRIVTPIPLPGELKLKNQGLLVLKVKPSAWFDKVDFSKFPEEGAPLYRFEDKTANQPDNALYSGLRAHSGPYHFSFEEPLNSATHASGTYPSRTYISETYPSGAYPSRTYISETYPSETYPSETYPSGTYPSETYPSETYPSETYPSEAYPSEAYPSGTYPSGANASETYAVEEAK
jgi:hypothetical protein